MNYYIKTVNLPRNSDAKNERYFDYDFLLDNLLSLNIKSIRPKKKKAKFPTGGFIAKQTIKHPTDGTLSLDSFSKDLCVIPNLGTALYCLEKLLENHNGSYDIKIFPYE